VVKPTINNKYKHSVKLHHSKQKYDYKQVYIDNYKENVKHYALTILKKTRLP